VSEFAFLQQTVEAFLDELASETPAPGGGSAAAIAVAMAAGLVGMAARVSDEWPEAPGVRVQADALRKRVAPLAEQDARAYADVIEARRASVGDEKLGKALTRAAAVPLKIAEAAADVAVLGAVVAEHGNANARADAGAAAALAEAGARAAAKLVEVNLATLEEDEWVARAREFAAAASAAAERALAAEE
jgi:formiminotetrahydrofolate cyclodeaminase